MSHRHHKRRSPISKRNTDSIQNLVKEITVKATHVTHVYPTREDALRAARTLPTFEEFQAATPPQYCTDCSQYSLKNAA